MIRSSWRFRLRQWRARRISKDTARVLAAIGRMTRFASDTERGRWLDLMQHNFPQHNWHLADDGAGGLEIDVE